MARGVLHLPEQLDRDREALAQRAHARPDVVVLDLRGEETERREVPGWRGTSTRGIPISCARASACIGPAPPKAIRVKSRGSCPRWIEISRIADVIRATAIVMTPSASASTVIERPRRVPSSARARRAPAASMAMLPPRRFVGPDAAEHDVRVRHGRLGAAEAVGDRDPARRRRCGARPEGFRRRRATRSSRRPRRRCACRAAGP